MYLALIKYINTAKKWEKKIFTKYQKAKYKQRLKKLDKQKFE